MSLARPPRTPPCRAVLTAVAFVLLAILPGVVRGAGDAPAPPAPLRPVDLRCEDLEDPIAIDTRRPRLRWSLEGSPAHRDRRQTAFRILAASSESLLQEDRADLWDSGRVDSDQQGQIHYHGAPLASHQDVRWKVRVWDENGRPGPWSPVARWRTAFLDPREWSAQWIEPDTTNALPLPLLRTAFVVRQPVTHAIVHLAGLGHHELFLDGLKVGNHFLDPAWSEYGKSIDYASHELTDRLPPGPHAFGVMLGKGFYHTAGDRRVHGVHSQRPLKLILEAHLTYADGTRDVVRSDASWRTHPGPITHSAILGGEDFDARRLPPGWSRPDFNDAGWTPVRVTEGPGGTLNAAIAPPMTLHQTFPPVSIDEPEPGVFVYDFGQNASAIPRVRLRGRPGQVVRLTPAEQRHGRQPRRNDGRGLVDQAGVGRPNYFEYTLRGGTPESWSPQFSYSGFQYLQVNGAVPHGHPNPDHLPVIEELVSQHVRASLPAVGQFECSLPLFNRIDRIIDWAVRGNLAHVLTDCPHREKLGWLEVAYLMGPSIAGRYDVRRFYRKISRDCADAQEPGGRVPTVAPAFPAFSGGFAYTPEWGAAAVVLPWLLHEWYGDTDTLERAYPAMRAFVDDLHATSPGLVPQPGLGDWYDYGHGKPVGASQFTPPELTAMATFQRCTRIVAEAAHVLRRPTEHARYAALAREITRAFNARWFDGTSAYTHSGSPQTSHSMALVLGLVPPGRSRAVLDAVLDDLRARGHQQTAGDIGHAYLLQALARANRSEVIADMTLRTNLGSYGFIVNNGWTSLPEAWDADTGASMNHCMLGHIQDWFLGDVAGLRPDPTTPGGARVLIAPSPVAALTWARGSYHSPRGWIATHWRRDNGRFHLELTLPPNTTARVILPAAPESAFLDDGLPLHAGSAVRHPVQGEGSVTFEVGSGTHRFSSRLPP